MISNWALSSVNAHLRDNHEIVGSYSCKFIDEGPPFYYENEGATIRAHRAVLTATYLIERKLAPFEFRIYFDMAKSRHVTNAAVALIEVGGVPANVVLSQDSSGQIKVFVVPTTSETKTIKTSRT
jgi:hypothetical protein